MFQVLKECQCGNSAPLFHQKIVKIGVLLRPTTIWKLGFIQQLRGPISIVNPTPLECTKMDRLHTF